jgi:hypothetical protein
LESFGATLHNELDQVDNCAIINCTKLQEPSGESEDWEET